MSEHYCTYFDHRFAARGLTMWRSLKRVSPSAALHILCLTPPTWAMIDSLALEDVFIYRLDELESHEPRLETVRGKRNQVEYYFTLTPFVPSYVLAIRPEIGRITYIDADEFFFADPQGILDEIGAAPIGIIEHRFPPSLAYLSKYGRFNVGWITFRRDPVAVACLERWQEQCLEWCYDRVEGSRFADQKYLDDWPTQFPQLHIVEHRGANVAAWNFGDRELSLTRAGPQVGGQPLLFFHAHGFRPSSPGVKREPNLAPYGVEETEILRRIVLDPYESALLGAAEAIALPLAVALQADQFRAGGPDREATARRLRQREEERTALLDRVSTLERRLEATEQALDVVKRAADALGDQLRSVEGARAEALERNVALEDQLGAVHDALVRTIDRLRVRDDDLAGVIGQLREQETELMRERARGAEREATLRRVGDDIAELQSQLKAVYESRSWRWTQPLRVVSRGWIRPEL